MSRLGALILSDEIPQALDTDPDLVWRYISKAQTHAIAAFAAAFGEKAFTGNISHLMLNCYGQKFGGVDVIGQLDPGKKTPVGKDSLSSGREIGIDAVDHGVTPFFVDLPNVSQMSIKIALIEELRT